MNKYAYVTLVTNLRYLDGAKFLHHSLKRVNSQYPLIIMVTENIKDDVLQINDFNQYNFIFIPYYQFKQDEVFMDTINKFQAFNLIQYNKVLFLDADILILENIDQVFKDHEHLHQDFIGYVRYSHEPDIIEGGFVLYSPNPNRFSIILNEHIFQPFDEKVLQYYFTQEPNCTAQMLNVEQYKTKYWHDAGWDLKYWEILKCAQRFASIEEILKYLDLNCFKKDYLILKQSINGLIRHIITDKRSQ